MVTRTAYVWMKEPDPEALAAFFAAYGGARLAAAGAGSVRVDFDDDQDDDDFRRSRELIVQEFMQDVAVFAAPPAPDYPVAAVLAELPRLGPGVYGPADIAREATLRGLSGLRTTLRRHYGELLGDATIDTVVGFLRADQNASKAASRLFMHRNTLNYRLDHFVAKTGIDVRSFAGGLAAFLLFRA